MQTHPVPVRPMTPDNAHGLGRVIDDFEATEVAVVRWPQAGWRAVKRGDEGGITRGAFKTAWRGELLMGLSDSFEVDNFHTEYVLGWSRDPAEADPRAIEPRRDRILVSLMNYHPDGGQVFASRRRRPFLLLLAPPGDDVTLEDCVALHSDGSVGFHIDPGVWHQAPFALAEEDVFDNKQGRVHAVAECDFPEEAGVYLSMPLRAVGT
jgi:ureidoglycolate lyase